MGLHRISEELSCRDGVEVLSTFSRDGTQRATAEEMEVINLIGFKVRNPTRRTILIDPGYKVTLPLSSENQSESLASVT